MKIKIMPLVALLLLAVGLNAQDRDFNYAPGFRYCPDRDFDLAWENDLVAFRVYGKQPNEEDGLSGIDCWHKRVNYPILDSWYGHLFTGKSYHTDYGEGCDQYHVGKTRGCGGLGIWKNGEILRSGLYESWEVISLSQTTLKFKLVYSWVIDGEKMVETRVTTLENGSQLMQIESQFTKNGWPVENLEIAVGLSTQNTTAKVKLNEAKGWMSAWHALGKKQGMIGTGAIVDIKYLVKMFEEKSENKDESHVIAVIKSDTNGMVKYSTGFAWEKAKKITSASEWNTYLEQY